MLNHKIKLINDQTGENKPYNRKSITELLDIIKTKNTESTINDQKLRLLRLQIDRVALNYKQLYRGLIETEIKSNNLNIAAEAIKERNDLVESIYNTVREEVSKQVSK